MATSILNDSLTASAWVFTSLIELGEITMHAFLSPSIYADLPTPSFELLNNQAKKKPIPKEMAIRQSIRRLQKQGFVERNNNKYSLTKIGREFANYIVNRKKVLTNKWDNKYRVVIFDIPEQKKDVRNWLRKELYFLNYKKLQESVFISKYPLTKDLVKEIKERKIGNCVNYLLVERVYKNIST